MTKKQIAAGQVRSLRAMKKKLMNMAAQWFDVDEYNANRLAELADQTETVAVELIEAPTEEAES
jgi:hypothetical protein